MEEITKKSYKISRIVMVIATIIIVNINYDSFFEHQISGHICLTLIFTVVVFVLSFLYCNQ